MMDASSRLATRVSLVVVVVSNHSFSVAPPVVRRSNPISVPTMDAGLRVITSPHCAGVVDLVRDGHISVKEGVARLGVFRHVGTPEQRASAVAALQFLARCPDVGIAWATRHVLHDRFGEESWSLFTQYRDAMAQLRLEYEDVASTALCYAASGEVASTYRIPAPSETVPDQADEDDAYSLESF